MEGKAWKTTEIAPTGDRRFLVWDSRFKQWCIGFWVEKERAWESVPYDRGGRFTHWMNIPEDPKEQEETP